MRKPINLILVLLLFLSVVITPPRFPAQAADPEVERLQMVVSVMEKINAISIDFETASAELTPDAAAKLRTQAALLKQLPFGTVMEIGVHTLAGENEAENLKINSRRAERIKSELVKMGVNSLILNPVGYGISKPNSDDLNQNGKGRNKRVEYLIEKLPPFSTANVENENTIVPGKGAGKLVLGMKMSDIEGILGKPEKIEDDTDLWGTLDYKYFSKGISVTFDATTKLATTIFFAGNTSGTTYKDFKDFNGKTDREITWGATSAEVIRAHGKPTGQFNGFNERREFVLQRIRYPDVEFGFHDDKLYYISNDKAYKD